MGAAAVTNEADLERFESKIQYTASACWIWTGSFSRTTSRPAPAFHVGGKTLQAARWIWEQVHGPIPARRSLRSTCGDSSCVNPAHRQLGSRPPADKRPPVQGPPAPPKTIADRVRRKAEKYQRRKIASGNTCQDCDEPITPNALRCRSCRDRERRKLYSKSPEKALANRYRAWKRRRDAQAFSAKTAR